tara:strand:+ start:318 stop:542 length:225 start_codon:yes stop_codon:yes gene_type:complete
LKLCKKCKEVLISKESKRKDLCRNCREPGIMLRLREKIFQKRLNKILEKPDNLERKKLVKALFKSKRLGIKYDI